MSNKCICNLKEGTEYRIVQGNWCDLLISLEKGKYWIIGEGDGRAMVKINYCPICGRKLMEVTK